VLEVLDLDLRGVDALGLEGLQQEEVGVGALGGGHPLARELPDVGDRGILADHDGGPLRLGVDVDGLDRRAVGAGEEGRGSGGGADVDGAGTEGLVGGVGAVGLHPLHLDALVLEPALVLDDQAQRVVGGVVDGEGVAVGLGPLAGRAGRGREQQRGCGRESGQAARAGEAGADT